MDLSKAELEKRYRTTKNVVLAKELGIAYCTLLNTLVRAGIKLKGPGNPKGRKPKYEIK